jgi:hypothetical protein
MSGKSSKKLKSAGKRAASSAAAAASPSAALDFDLAATPAERLLNGALFDAHKVGALQRRFRGAAPFAHLVIPDFCRVRWSDSNKEQQIQKENNRMFIARLADLEILLDVLHFARPNAYRVQKCTQLNHSTPAPFPLRCRSSLTFSRRSRPSCSAPRSPKRAMICTISRRRATSETRGCRRPPNCAMHCMARRFGSFCTRVLFVWCRWVCGQIVIGTL